MDFYVIPPLNNVELHHTGDRYFCLAQHYIKNQDYREFFLNLPSDAWVTLDNGAGDHSLVTEDVLLEVVKELKPSEVIPLDILFNKHKTMANALRFNERLNTLGLSKEDMPQIMFVPQGRTIEEWVDCYEWANAQPWISTIGMSKIGIPFAFHNATQDNLIMESRHDAFDLLRKRGLIQKPMHFLGLGDPTEFEYYRCFPEYSFVRSNDSCNSVWAAMNGQSWPQGDHKRIATPLDYFEREVHPGAMKISKDNFNFLKQSVGR